MSNSNINKWERYFNDRGLSPQVTAVYSKYVQGLTETNSPIIFEFEHLSKLLGIKQEQLSKIVNSPDSFYRTFQIPKKSGGHRTIASPYPSLLSCQRWIYANILLKQQVHNSAHGFIPGRSIVTNAKGHLGSKVLLKMDLKNFFPSIPINWVINFFSKLGYASNVAYYLASLCCYENCLGQGSATSPYLSNILLKSFDERLLRLSRSYDLHYSRYADDLTFSGNYIPHLYISLVDKVVTQFGLEVNSTKTRLHTKPGQKIVTGISVSGKKLCLPRSSKRDLKKEIYFINKYGYLSFVNKMRINDPFYFDSLFGKLQFLLQIEPDSDFANTAISSMKKLKAISEY
jgi:RNA-directed DNA polymerase